MRVQFNNMAKFIFIFVLILSGLKGFSESVPIDKAKIVATNWYRHYAPIDKTQGNIDHVAEYKRKDITSFYLFSFDKGGFVIVSAIDQVDPILGYGFEGKVPETIDNPAVKDCFENFALQIDTIGELNLKSAKVELKWDQLTKNIFLKSGALSIGPLLATTWNQGCYYNTSCPADANGACGHVWTGCNATTMAQLMKYWNFPTIGADSHSYSHPTYGNLSANFSSTTYQWSQMPNNVTSQNVAVATLMFHCGVAVNMNYGPDGSSSSQPRDALVNYFKYSSQAKYLEKQDYSTDAWVSLMKSELDLKRPIYYNGFNPSSGHAFVCDGYQNTDYFHFNWGWGGYLDGYFYLANLNPGGSDFSSGQGAIIKIVPSSLPDGYVGLFLLENALTMGANGGNALVNIASSANWTASSSQLWLSINPGNGLPGTSKLTLTASQNNTGIARSAIVTVSATGFDNQVIKISQPPKVAVTAGALVNVLAGELATTTNLSLTGTIDARDFKTMRDNMPLLTEIDLSGVNIAAYTGKDGTEDVVSVVYPANAIPNYAFSNNTTWQGKTNLNSIVLPSSVTAIGNIAFANCIGLTSVSIPPSVSSIGYYAFFYCTNLISVNIPSSVTFIDYWAFLASSGSITVDANNPNYSSSDGILFNKLKTKLIQCPTSKTGSYSIPSSVTLLDDQSFYECEKITAVTIPSSVTSIGGEAFLRFSGSINVDTNNPNYSSLDGVLFNKVKTTLIQCPNAKAGTYVIPSTVTSIADESFYECRNLTAITIPKSVTTIGAYAFYNCAGLTSLIIPSSVNGIGSGAFRYCNSLTSIITFGTTPINLISSSGVFSNIDKTNCTLNVPYGTSALYRASDQWKDFTKIVEMAEFKLSAASASIAAAGGSASIDLTTTLTWTASSDQVWLTVSPSSGTGNKSLSFSAGANSTASKRIAIVTVLAAGLEPRTITISQECLLEQQSISLNSGWNIISFKLTPSNLDLMAIFQPLITAGTLKKVMDEAGKTIENFGAFGGWKNNIGNLNAAKGYKVNVTAAATLSLEGTAIPLPVSISLASGWNIISYPCATAQDAKALVQTLIDGALLKKVMDEAGKTIENFGTFGGWKNNIGNFLPGKGYKVNVISACTLSITGPANKAGTNVPEVLAATNFDRVYIGNGTDHFNVHLVDLASSGLNAGDQIGIFDGSYCVGAATISADQLMGGTISIPSSFNDEVLSGKVNGFTEGHAVTLQLYRENKAYPLTPSIVSGSQAFEKNGSLFVKVVASDLPVAKISVGADLVKCYPNPFSEQLTIEIQLAKPRKLDVKIYDLTGQLIRSLYCGKAGMSETLIWDGTSGQGTKMGSGTYILKVNEMIEKIALK